MDPIIIEKGIPIPTKNSRTRPKSKKYEFLHKMNVGDSVEIKVLKAPYVKGSKSRNNTLTYYGLMNAVHKTQKTNVQNNFNIGVTPHIGITPNTNHKKFTVRTIRLENITVGMLRVLRVWRTV